MGCLKLDIEHTYTGLKIVYRGTVTVSRGSGKNEVETNYYYFGEQGNKSQVNLAFGRRETEQSQSPVFDKVESQHFGIMTKCLCGNRYYDPRTSQWLSVDPMAGKFPNMSPYNYCAGNPVKFIDPDGMDIIPYVYRRMNNNGEWVGQRGLLSKNTLRMLTAMVQTKSGREFLGNFAKAGQTVAGYTFKEDGKYSNHDLVIQDFLADQVEGNVPIMNQGTFIVQSDPYENDINFNIQLMTVNMSNEYESGETAAHEMMLHGYKIDDYVKAFNKGGLNAVEIMKQNINKTDPYGKKDHDAYRNRDLKHNGYSRYVKLMNELIKVDPNYKNAFESAEMDD